MPDLMDFCKFHYLKQSSSTHLSQFWVSTDRVSKAGAVVWFGVHYFLSLYNSGSPPLGRDPIWGVKGPFHRSCLRPSENTDIMVHNSNQITVMKQEL